MARVFLSTPSARRATKRYPGGKDLHCISIHALREEGDKYFSKGSQMVVDFYPRPPRGGRPQSTIRRRIKLLISIHALREEGDAIPPQATGGILMISIHALREEGDTTRARRGRTSHNFYPRPPRGGRHFAKGTVIITSLFLSTPSARRATREERLRANLSQISIHALREEGDAQEDQDKAAEV